MNCPSDVEFEFLRKAGNAFLSRPSLVQYVSKCLSALKGCVCQISYPGTRESLFTHHSGWRLGTIGAFHDPTAVLTLLLSELF